jgi:hypothetical protein
MVKQKLSQSRFSSVGERKVLEHLASQLVRGQLKIAMLPLAIPAWSYEQVALEEEEKPAAALPPLAEEPHWIEYQFVDSAGNPITDISYEFTGVDGRKQKGTLPQNGIVRRGGLPVGGQCTVKLFSITNAKWSQDSARVGDVVKLSADVEGYENGTKAVFEIWEIDIKSSDDFITKIDATVQKGKIESECTYEYIEDTDEVSDEDEKKGYSSPEYYFIVKIKDSKARSDLLEFRDCIEIELKDEEDDPVPNEDYILYLSNGEVRKGQLDGNGFKKEENIPPGECSVRFPKRSHVSSVE